MPGAHHATSSKGLLSSAERNRLGELSNRLTVHSMCLAMHLSANKAH